VYGYTDHASAWTAKIKDMWSESPKALPKGGVGGKSPGKQFGNKHKSLYNLHYSVQQWYNIYTRLHGAVLCIRSDTTNAI
jgi:hypothetical protein